MWSFRPHGLQSFKKREKTMTDTTNEKTMTDIPVEPNNEKKYTANQVSQIVIDRLDRAEAGKEQLAQRLAALEEKHANLAQAAKAVDIGSQVPTSTMPAQVTGDPSVAPAGLTQEGLSQALEQHQNALAQQKQEQDLAQAHQYHSQNLQELMGDDKDFKSLVEQNEAKVPLPVAIQISNSFTPEQSKKIFKELLTNENTNLKMKNAFLESTQNPQSGNYEKWLSQLVRQNNNGAPNESAPSPVPELSNSPSGDTDSEDMDGIMNYMTNR